MLSFPDNDSVENVRLANHRHGRKCRTCLNLLKDPPAEAAPSEASSEAAPEVASEAASEAPSESTAAAEGTIMYKINMYENYATKEGKAR